MLNERIAIYPGTFDPLTMGHLNIIGRAAKVVDRLIIGVATNINKSKSLMFSHKEREAMIKEAVTDISNTEVKIFDGLLVDFARSENSRILIRGLRAVSDFEYEFKMAWVNHRLAPDIETIFFTSSEETQFISSQIIKEIISLDGDCSEFVPDSVIDHIKRRSHKA